MKPLTPRMQIFFMGEEIDSVEKPHRRRAAGPLEGALVEHCTVHFQRKDAQRRAVTAFGVAAPVVAIQRRKADALSLFPGQQTAQDPDAPSGHVAEGAGVGRCNAAHEIVDLCGAALPVDASVLWFATAEV